MRILPFIAVTIIACSGDHRPPGDGAGRDTLSSIKEWRDPSAHQVTFVKVAPNVRLEVLDWGGTGDLIVFLCGLGNTAHVFDEYAPQFRDHYRVIGITRRGWGASSQPGVGYDIGTRVSDVLTVLDSLRVAKSTFVGHSLAGGELTAIAARHPDRVARLVYLEAAYDWSDQSAMPPEPSLPWTPQDSISPEAVRAHMEYPGIPEAEVRAIYRFGTDGKLIGDVTPDSIGAALVRGWESPPFDRVRAPTLAIYSLWESPTAHGPTKWALLDPVRRSQLLATWHWWRPHTDEQRALFRRKVPQAQVVELLGAHHYIYISNPVEVTAAIRHFLASR